MYALHSSRSVATLVSRSPSAAAVPPPRRSRRTAAPSACSDVLSVVASAWSGLRAKCRRRRNSYKLFLYFQLQALQWFAVTVAAVVFYTISWINLHTVKEDCLLPPEVPAITSDSQLRNLTTVTNREAFVCEDEGAVTAACDLSDVRSILDPIVVSAVLMLSQCLVCSMLAMSFHMFTNLAAELLQHGKTTRETLILGGLCKQGPWVVRLLHLMQFFVLLYLSICLLALQRCAGDTTKTYDCINYQFDCAYNKMKNCRYYYRWCTDSPDEFLQCLTAEFREAFSGRVDIRLLHHSQCVRCEILEADRDNANDDDEFYLLDEQDRGTDKWLCEGNAEVCFHTRVWSSLVCACDDDMKNLMATAVYNERCVGCGSGSCSGSATLRRQEASENSTSVALVGAPLNTTVSAAPTSPSNASSVTEAAPTAQPKTSSALPMVDASHGAANLCESGEDTDLCEQECYWAPQSSPAYFFQEDQCRQTGSYVWRQAATYLYLSSCVWIGVTLTGQLVRLFSRPEPWFFNPRPAREFAFWKFLRLLGP